MNFAYPAVLLLLVLPVGLIAWEMRRTGTPLTMPFDHGDLREGLWLRRLLMAGACLPALLLGMVILLLAGPQVPQVSGEQREMKNIIFCLDMSGSMGADYAGVTRYEAAMEALQEFTHYREGDAFGLTIFGNEVMHWVPVTRDLSALEFATPFLGPDKMPRYFGGTQIGKALMACRQKLTEQNEGDRMVILLSDGWSSDLGGERTYEIGANMRGDKIRVFTVNVSNGDAPADMYTISGMTDGAVFNAGDPAALKEVFQQIDGMSSVRMKPVAPRYADFFWPFALAGMIALGIHQLAQLGLRYTPW